MTKLRREVFQRYYQLNSITIPSSVVEISNYCFEECISLTTITIPTTVTKFGICCFHKSGITKENYPNIPNEYFKEC